MLQARLHLAGCRLRQRRYNLSGEHEAIEARHRITRMIEGSDNPHINSTATTDCPNLMRWVGLFLDAFT